MCRRVSFRCWENAGPSKATRLLGWHLHHACVLKPVSAHGPAPLAAHRSGILRLLLVSQDLVPVHVLLRLGFDCFLDAVLQSGRHQRSPRAGLLALRDPRDPACQSPCQATATSAPGCHRRLLAACIGMPGPPPCDHNGGWPANFGAAAKPYVLVSRGICYGPLLATPAVRRQLSVLCHFVTRCWCEGASCARGRSSQAASGT